MKPDKPFVKSIVSNVVIILFMIMLVSQLNSLSRQVTSMNHQLQQSDGQSELFRLSNKVDELLQEERWLTEYHWSVVDVDPDQQIIALQYEWSLQEVSADAKIALQVQQLNEERQPISEWDMVKVDNIGANAYKASIDVTPSHYYGVQVVSQGDLQRVSQSSTIPSYLYQAPELVPSSASFNHRTDPNYDEDDVSIGFSVFHHDDPEIKVHPSLNFIAESVTAELVIDGELFTKKLEQTEVDTSNFHPDQYRTEWMLEFPPFSKGDLGTLILNVEYTNGFVISKDYTDHLHQFFPNLE